MDDRGDMGFSLDRVSRSFATRRGRTVALRNVSFAAEPREFLSIVGPSGCGKTTLLKLIAGLLDPTSGTIAFGDPPSPRHPRNALVFQEHGVFPWMTVLENVAFPLKMQGVGTRAREERAFDFVDRVGLGPVAESHPRELSSGMRQRVGVARAFAADVPLLLMDEPFGALDAQTKRVLQEELLRLWRTDRKLVVFVTHDVEEAVRLGDRVIVLTGRPGQVRATIPVPIPRPRDPGSHRSRVTELSGRIWEMLEEEARWKPGIHR